MKDAHTKQTAHKSKNEEEIHTEVSADLISEYFDSDMEACHHLIALAGSEANKVSYSLLKSVIAGLSGVGGSGIILYLFHDQTRWYTKFSSVAHTAHYARLHEQTFKAIQPRATIKI